MHIHILGICGTFMGGVAQLACEAGHKVTGCDAHVYPPMSDALRNAGIEIMEGYDVSQLDAVRPDVFVIGNAISRGNPLLEAILNRGAFLYVRSRLALRACACGPPRACGRGHARQDDHHVDACLDP